MWRTIAPTVGWADPARLACADVVGDQLAGGSYDHDVVNHQRGTGEAPTGHFGIAVGGDVAGPHHGAVAGIERVQNSGCAKRIHSTVADGRCRAWTCPGIGFPKPDGVVVSPNRLAIRHPIASDELVITALLLRVGEIAA